MPGPSGPLSERVPSPSIEAANNKVSELIANPLESALSSESEIYRSQSKTKRQRYLILTPAQRYEIGKRAAQNGIAVSLAIYRRDPSTVQLIVATTTSQKYGANRRLVFFAERAPLKSSYCQ